MMQLIKIRKCINCALNLDEAGTSINRSGNCKKFSSNFELVLSTAVQIKTKLFHYQT